MVMVDMGSLGSLILSGMVLLFFIILERLSISEARSIGRDYSHPEVDRIHGV